jgi:hypothetical protein
MVSKTAINAFMSLEYVLKTALSEGSKRFSKTEKYNYFATTKIPLYS